MRNMVKISKVLVKKLRREIWADIDKSSYVLEVG